VRERERERERERQGEAGRGEGENLAIEHTNINSSSFYLCLIFKKSEGVRRLALGCAVSAMLRRQQIIHKYMHI
jgi:hypothetical protein